MKDASYLSDVMAAYVQVVAAASRNVDKAEQGIHWLLIRAKDEVFDGDLVSLIDEAHAEIWKTAEAVNESLSSLSGVLMELERLESIRGAEEGDERH